MKCEVCLQLLEEYLDGELREAEVAPISAHLVACASCANEFEALTAEQEIYSRYDRELDISATMWNQIAARTVELQHTIEQQPNRTWRAWFAVPSLSWSFAGALAVLLIAIVLGVSYFRQAELNREKQEALSSEPANPVKPGKIEQKTGPTVAGISKQEGKRDLANANVPHHQNTPKLKTMAKLNAPSQKPAADQSDVLFSDAAYAAVEDQETQVHIENAQNLLRSVRNIEITDDDSDIDVTYEKALSRRLLNENIVLRREAEMSGKFPTKELLSDLEPFLIDIANLPDKSAADDLRVIKQRVQKTEIVAALQGY